MSFIVILMSSLLLGFRHGVDWDHIAAITDLVGVESKPKQGMLLATMYSLGHGVVILVLGLSAVGIGGGAGSIVKLPTPPLRWSF